MAGANGGPISRSYLSFLSLFRAVVKVGVRGGSAYWATCLAQEII